MEEIRRKLERQILEQMDYRKDISDEDIAEMIDSAIVNLEELACCPVSQRIRLKTDLFNSLRRLDLLQIFVEDEEVTEIMINGKDTIFLEKSGRLVRYPRGFDSAEKLMDVIQMIVAGCNRVINTSTPIVDARLEGSQNPCGPSADLSERAGGDHQTIPQGPNHHGLADSEELHHGFGGGASAKTGSERL